MFLASLKQISSRARLSTLSKLWFISKPCSSYVSVDNVSSFGGNVFSNTVSSPQDDEDRDSHPVLLRGGGDTEDGDKEDGDREDWDRVDGDTEGQGDTEGRGGREGERAGDREDSDKEDGERIGEGGIMQGIFLFYIALFFASISQKHPLSH